MNELTQSMKVMMVHNAYGTRSGEEVVVDQQVELLREKGVNVECFNRTSEVIGSSVISMATAFFSGIYNRSSVKNFREKLEEFRPDIVHIHNLYPWISPAVLPECGRRNIPVVMTVHNYRLFCPNGLMFSCGEVCDKCLRGNEIWCLLRNCEGSIPKSAGYAIRNFHARVRNYYRYNVSMYATLTEFQREIIVDAGVPRERTMVIPNPVSLPASAENGDSSGDIVGYAGRVSREKGINILLQAARRFPDLSFEIAGSPGNSGNLPDELPANVRLLGQLSAEKMEPFYRRCRVVIVPSIWNETFCLVAAEAMAHSRPVLASSIGGLPEVVEDGVTGLLFRPGDVNDLVQKLDYLWNNEDACRKMGKAGRDRVSREFSTERYFEDLMSAYDKALQH